MNKQIHFAVQYLATASKSFMRHRPDDSHTNLGFDSKTESFETWELNENGLKLLFDLSKFQLKWSTGESLNLNGKTHVEVISWLIASSKQLGFKKPYTFDLHYDLPFEWDVHFSFTLPNTIQLQEFIALRKLANTVLKAFLHSENIKSDIRIWPHHFDTGAFVVPEDGSGKSIGLGMAIPDAMVNDHYFYLSGYLGHKAWDTSAFPELSIGAWKNDGFKGAVLPATNTSEKKAIQFLKEGYNTYHGIK